MLSNAIFVIKKFCFIAGTPKRPGDAPSGAVFIAVGKFYSLWVRLNGLEMRRLGAVTVLFSSLSESSVSLWVRLNALVLLGIPILA